MVLFGFCGFLFFLGEAFEVFANFLHLLIAALDGGVGGPVNSRVVPGWGVIEVRFDKVGIGEGVHAELQPVAIVADIA